MPAFLRPPYGGANRKNPQNGRVGQTPHQRPWAGGKIVTKVSAGSHAGFRLAATQGFGWQPHRVSAGSHAGGELVNRAVKL